MSLSDREKAMRNYPDEFDDEQDEETGEYIDCHMGRDGLCGKAGSEECEFECPYRAEERASRQRENPTAYLPCGHDVSEFINGLCVRCSELHQ